MKKYISLGAVALVLLVGAYWGYQQKKLALPITTENTQNTTSSTTSVTTSDNSDLDDLGGPWGNAVAPDCATGLSGAVVSCASLGIRGSIELSDAIKNSTYVVDIVKGFPVFHSYFEPRSLGAGQALIKRDIYNNLFPNNPVARSTSDPVFSPRCTLDKATLPSITSNLCDKLTQDEEYIYLFDEKGKRTITVANLNKNLIHPYPYLRGQIGQTDSLLSVKKLQTNTNILFDSGTAYVPIDKNISEVVVMFSGSIKGNELVPIKKTSEIIYYKDGTTDEIKVN